MPNEVFRISMSEIREKFLANHRNHSAGISEKNRVVSENSCVNRPFDSWAGGGSEETVNYLENGFNAVSIPAFDTTVIPVRKKKRSRFNDCEGDFRFDLYSAGDENCFVEWSKRESIPGIHVQFFYGFLANVPATTIEAYTDWILGALTTLESAGVDCSISAFNRGRNRYQRGNSEITEIHIEVKRESERNDYTDWSALFAPGAYRTLGFFTMLLSAEFNNRTINSSFGASNGNEWAVKFNEETRVIEIMALSTDDGEFPEAKMTEQLGAAIAAARVN